MHNQFAEIQLSGGIITFYPDGHTKFVHDLPLPCSIFPFSVKTEYILPDRHLTKVELETEVYLVGDVEGLFGRQCPKCKSYFRTKNTLNVSCPYCSAQATHFQFITDNQLEFLRHFVQIAINSKQTNTVRSIDLYDITRNLTNNTPPIWVYAEEKQQKYVYCKDCKNKYDILGEYGGCPWCEKRNSFEVIFEKIESVYETLDSDECDATTCLTTSVSYFEAMANDLKNSILNQYKVRDVKTFKNLSFQRIFIARDILIESHDIDIFENISEACIKNLKKLFEKRHIYVHNGGRADQKYISNSEDGAVRLNQTVPVSINEVEELLATLSTVAVTLIRQSHNLINKDRYSEKNPLFS